MTHGSYRQVCPVAMITLTGDPKLASSMQTWLGLSPFAVEQKLAS